MILDADVKHIMTFFFWKVKSGQRFCFVPESNTIKQALTGWWPLRRCTCQLLWCGSEKARKLNNFVIHFRPIDARGRVGVLYSLNVFISWSIDSFKQSKQNIMMFHLVFSWKKIFAAYLNSSILPFLLLQLHHFSSTAFFYNFNLATNSLLAFLSSKKAAAFIFWGSQPFWHHVNVCSRYWFHSANRGCWLVIKCFRSSSSLAHSTLNSARSFVK